MKLPDDDQAQRARVRREHAARMAGALMAAVRDIHAGNPAARAMWTPQLTGRLALQLVDMLAANGLTPASAADQTAAILARATVQQTPPQ